MKVIIVHNNERTVNRCVEIIRSQGEEPILISENNFGKSLRSAFEIAVANNWDWFVFLGGDQFLRQNTLQILQNTVNLTNGQVFRISGWGYDHLHLKKRLMAPCVYKVQHIEEALSIDFDLEIRPETFVMKEMDKKGYKSIIIKDVLAKHDMEQFYTDIYRKGYSQYQKSKEYLMKILPEIFLSNEMDHKVFLLGIIDAANGKKRKNILQSLNIKEKQPL
jgi:hypothetical protein